MMKKVSLLVALIMLLIATFSTNVFAYYIQDVTPGTDSLNYYTHSSLGTSGKTAATSAASTWTAVSNGIDFSNSGDSSGNIGLGDSRSDVSMANFNDLSSLGIPSSANAVTAIVEDDYTNFDILLNSTKSWGDGNSGSYLDRRGILTHEFGHAAGLDENGTLPINTSPDKIEPSLYQTMWPYSEDPLRRPVSYYFRSLEFDDINGVQAVASGI